MSDHGHDDADGKKGRCTNDPFTSLTVEGIKSRFKDTIVSTLISVNEQLKLDGKAGTRNVKRGVGKISDGSGRVESRLKQPEEYV